MGTHDQTTKPYFAVVGICAIAAIALFISSGAYAQLPSTIDLSQPPGSEGSPVVRIYGPSDAGGIGAGVDATFFSEGRYGDGGVAYGDFNGDGLADIALGGPGADLPMSFDNGCVYILFGHHDSAGQALSLTTGNAGPGEARIFGAEDVALGRSLAAGDFNGDGFDDILMGALRDAPSPCGSNPLYIVYGSATMAGQTYLLPVDDLAFQTDGVPSFMAVVCYTSPADYMGLTLAVGDFDGDGHDDFAAGFGDIGPFANMVVFGNTLEPGQATVLDGLGSNNAQISGGSHVGYTLGSGDINGDGFDDVVLGDIQSISGANGWDAYIVYGHASLMGNDFDLGFTPVAGTTKILGHALSPGYRKGPAYVTAGDIDGDGLDDLVVSSEADGERTITFVYGADILGNAVVDLADSGQGLLSTRYSNNTLAQNLVNGKPYVPTPGDINGDGFLDILLGAPELEVPRAWPAGRAFVLYGSPALRGASPVLNAPEGDLHLVSASTGTDEFGISPSTGGDFNGDGFADFTVAAPLGATAETNGGGYAVQVYGAGTAESATAIEAFRAGNAPSKGFGGRMSPVLRAHLAFTGGDAAPATATLTRNLDAISNFDEPDKLANVTWEISTTRADWNSAQVKFRYLDTEAAGLIESALVLYRAPDPSGPWTEVATQSVDARRNEITATVDQFGHFVIAQKGTGMPAAGLWALAAAGGLLCLAGVRCINRTKT